MLEANNFIYEQHTDCVKKVIESDNKRAKKSLVAIVYKLPTF